MSFPENDDRLVGNFAVNPECASLLEEGDLLISIGTRFRSNETKHYELALPRPHVQIDLDERALGRAFLSTPVPPGTLPT